MKLAIASATILLSAIAPEGQAEEVDLVYPVVSRVLERAGIAPEKPRQSGMATPASADDGGAAATTFTPTAQAWQGEAAALPGEHDATADVRGFIVIFDDEQAKTRSANNQPPRDALVTQMEEAIGVPVRYKRAMSLGAFVFEFTRPLTQAEFAPVQQALDSLAVIESASADTMESAKSVPNDPYYYYQWSLKASGDYSDYTGSEVFGANVEAAWDIAQSRQPTTVAVLDTGLNEPAPFDPLRLLPGYDFISEPERSNDGDGRDFDPFDNGDYREEGQCNQFPDSRDSTWHGNRVASVIAADRNDGQGMAGIDDTANILPVRVMGRCGGLASDIIDGMLWAAGIDVPGVPTNTNPARILNMSFGAHNTNACPAIYQTAIDQVRARNALVVVSAGNEDKDVAYTQPASCEGVIVVSALNHHGDRADYSNWSRTGGVNIAAPGGKGGGEYLVAARDDGATEPTGESGIYFSSGTSIAAPHVSGVLSMAMGHDPQQHAYVIAAILEATAQPFKAGTECHEEYPLCGPGALDAKAMMEGVKLFEGYSPVLEFYHAGNDHYFRTGSWDEIVKIKRGEFGAWEETGDDFLGWRDASEADVLPVCRFYGTPDIGPNSHFYTVDPDECETVKQSEGWTYEGVPFYAKMPVAGSCPADSIPVYRYYNQRAAQNDSNHRFATHLDDRQAMEAEGWVMEGVSMCVPDQ